MKSKQTIRKPQTMHKQQGAVLLEALIAIVIFSFGLLAIAGLQAAMMKNTADATFRAEASYIVQQRVGEMLINPFSLVNVVDAPIPSLPAGKLNITPLTEGRLKFIVTWQNPGEPEHNYQATTSIFLAREKI